MRRALSSIAILLSVSAAHASTSTFSGLWFRCEAKWEAADNFMLLEVAQDHRNWVAEWGVAYSASGAAELDSDGNLILRGCKSYRGEVEDSCDRDNPQIFLTLEKAVVDRPAMGSDRSLQRGQWIRTDDKSWQTLAKRCARLK